MVAEFQGVTHHSWHPLHNTIRMQIDIPAAIVIAAPHDRRIHEELPAKEAAVAYRRQVKGVRFNFIYLLGNHVTASHLQRRHPRIAH